MAQMPRSAILALLGTCVRATWHQMPDGKFYHQDCIHQFGDDFHVEEVAGSGSRVSFADGEALWMPPCPYAPRAAAEEEEAPRNGSLRGSPSAPNGYYSDWAAYAQTVHSEGYGSMSSDWNVPAEPVSKGPAPPLIESSIYLFNGLEPMAVYISTAALATARTLPGDTKR
eukprot:TRINITY_DN19825_c0_g1_i1.p1 TRINITY_DN19825_c0_g1~~TRINITY_DN19825_c0_g1_i1.p1  ORF type:complete len:187 (+),score=30.99 TRINITY_DN19825_c0_g1_i1:53-562(+)